MLLHGTDLQEHCRLHAKEGTVVHMVRDQWEEELDALAREFALYLASARQREGREQAYVLRCLLMMLDDIRILVSSRITELEQPAESWKFGVGT